MAATAAKEKDCLPAAEVPVALPLPSPSPWPAMWILLGLLDGERDALEVSVYPVLWLDEGVTEAVEETDGTGPLSAVP